MSKEIAQTAIKPLLRKATCAGVFLILAATVCLAQEGTSETGTENRDILGRNTDGRNKIFISRTGEFVIPRVLAINLILPGSGNIIYAKKAKKESTILRGLTLTLGLWSLYNNTSYVAQYFDRDRHTPTAGRTRLFLIGYTAGNVLNYLRLRRYNRRVVKDSELAWDYEVKENSVYVQLSYRF